MPAPTSFDLEKLESWCGCRPGMSRAQVGAALHTAGVIAEPYGDEMLTVTEDGWEMDFYFATDGSGRLRQISLDGDAIQWAGHPLMDLRVHEALQTIRPLGPALWTAYDAAGTPFPDSPPTPAEPVSDEALLLESTIWLPEQALGLVIYEGAVFGVVWREARDLPVRYAGPVTAAQRELSQRPDLASYLHEREAKAIDAAAPRDPLRFARLALTLAALAALALTARHGMQEMFLWGDAPTVKARLISVERGPLKQFFEYLPAPVVRILPQWLLAGSWSGMPPQTDLYRMQYTDARNQPREVRLESAEFYTPPREPGTEVDLIYADGDPPRVKGPARARDAAFMEHIPWVISIGILWLLAHLALNLLPPFVRLLRHARPAGRPLDPHRPELS